MRCGPEAKCVGIVVSPPPAGAVVRAADRRGDGKLVGTDGLVLPGVTVEARAEALPGPRVTVSDGRGVYRLQALPPGLCTITFELSGMAKVTKEVLVQLNQDTVVDITMSVAGVAETVVVSATDRAGHRQGLGRHQERRVVRDNQEPAGRPGVRNLIKLIPGVQYTQESVRGPSAGGSGQDNVYKFDGVNVTLPMYGTLSAEPASYDIAQVTTIKGGAKAVDFERAGGFGGYRQQVRHECAPRPNRLPAAECLDGGRGRRQQPLEVRPDPRLAHDERGRPRDQEQAVLLRGRTTGRRYRGRTRPTLTAHCRTTRASGTRDSSRPRSLRPTHCSSTSAGASRTGSKPGRRSARRLGHDRLRQRSLAEDRDSGRLVDHQLEELRVLQVHVYLPTRRPGGPTTRPPPLPA